MKVDYHDLDFGGNVTTVYGEKPLGDVVQNVNKFAYTDKSFRTVLDLKYLFGNGVTLSSLTGYQDIESVNNLDLNATAAPASTIFNSRIDAQVYSQEFNLISPNDQPFKWVLGVFWQKQDSLLPSWEKGGFNFIGDPGFLPGVGLQYPWATSPWDNTETDSAVFAHVAIPFSDRVELEVGARYSDYSRDQFTEWLLDVATAYANQPPAAPWPGTTPGGDRQSLGRELIRLAGRVEFRCPARPARVRVDLPRPYHRRHQHFPAIPQLHGNGSHQLRDGLERQLGR